MQLPQPCHPDYFVLLVFFVVKVLFIHLNKKVRRKPVLKKQVSGDDQKCV